MKIGLKDKILSIVIPVYNEADILPELAKALDQALTFEKFKHEFIFIGDGSTDNSWDVLLGIYRNRTDTALASLSRRFGKDTAVFAGLEKGVGDAVVVIDADMQDPPLFVVRKAITPDEKNETSRP